MTRALPISELDVIGFVGQFPPEDWPVRLMPIYRARGQALGLWPPFQEQGERLEGEPLTAEELEDMLAEGELTPLPEPLAAREDHLLWLAETGPRYAPRVEAERELVDLCRKSVVRAMELGLKTSGARELLFRALRAHPTTVANALLAVHFQLVGDYAQARPLREDLTALAHTPPSSLEQDLVRAIAPDKLGRELATAIAMELGRARRDELVSALLDAARVSEPIRQAARPAPPLRWEALRQAA